MTQSPTQPATPEKNKPTAPNAAPDYLTEEQKKAAQAERAANQSAPAKA